MKNSEIADLLRSVAAAYSLQGANRFQIIAYESAADGIEHLTSDVVDVWKNGGIAALEAIPGVGKSIAAHLDELMKTDKVTHFEDVLKDYPEGMFELLKIPGVGPKTALKLSESGILDLHDLKLKIHNNKLPEGVSESLVGKLKEGLGELSKRSDRMLLPTAKEISDQVLGYLNEAKFIHQADTLGSLRRRVSTVGDIDIAIASDDMEKVAEFVAKLPILKEVLESGPNSLTLLLKNGIRVDVMVQPAKKYGALLQHFTGSKHHNIKLRNLAHDKGYSLSEYGVKEIKTDHIIDIKDEDKIYEILKMQVPPPEIREDAGEIELALEHKLPDLIKLEDIKGDVHNHTTWSDGRGSVTEMAQKAKSLGYKYFALTDHSYPSMDFKKRINQIEQYNDSDSDIRVIIGLEVNINADCSLQVDDKILEMQEFNLGSIHTSFRQDKEQMTKRLLTALAHPFINGIAHPTGRILLERSGTDVEWEAVFEAALLHDKFLEINSFPDRLDLPDQLVREAVKAGVKLTIVTDSHDVSHMELMEYGVSVARRGWVEAKNVLNILSFEKFVKAANVRLRR